jgi:hypothetical protein
LTAYAYAKRKYRMVMLVTRGGQAMECWVEICGGTD